jgi:hypothetical protein
MRPKFRELIAELGTMDAHGAGHRYVEGQCLRVVQYRGWQFAPGTGIFQAVQSEHNDLLKFLCVGIRDSGTVYRHQSNR